MPHTYPPREEARTDRVSYYRWRLLLRSDAALALAVSSKLGPYRINYPAVEVRIGGAARAVKNGARQRGRKG
jgi:hypothetical protein